MPLKALFSLDPDNLQLHCFFFKGGGGGSIVFVFVPYPLNQPCKTFQMVLVAPFEKIF